MSIERLAVYTTVYPQVMPFLPDWYRSVKAQTDRQFTLCVALDCLEPSDVGRAVGGEVDARWFAGSAGDTPARIRCRALREISASHDAVVLADADDVMERSRVAAARRALGCSDVAACALSIIDQDGFATDRIFTVGESSAPEALLPRYNVFGFSNSAYRCDVLARCLPIPSSAVLVDWYVVTRAWLAGARLAFDRSRRMRYRQYAQNLACVVPPFSAQQIATDTVRVLQHFGLILEHAPRDCRPERLQQVGEVYRDVTAFHARVVERPAQLRRYTELLNALNPQPLWWISVAHPQLRALWA